MSLKSFFYIKNKRSDKTCIRVLRIPVYKYIRSEAFIKKYFFGIRFCKKIISDKNINKHIEAKLSDIESKLMFAERAFMEYNAVENLSNNKSSNKIAIFLAGSGAIAEYTVRIHSTMPDKFDIFADVESISQWNNLRSLHPKAKEIVFPLSSFEAFSKVKNYTKKIFVLGNSEHHKKVFDFACLTKGEPNRYLILHEPVCLGAIYHKLYLPLEKCISDKYPGLKIKDLKKDLYTTLYKHNICLIKPVIEMTGIRDIIVYSERSKLILEKEYKDVNCSSVSLPIEPYNDIMKIFPKEDKEFLVGCFGMPNNFSKRTKDIIEAVSLLNEKYSVKLIVAGIGVDRYIETLKKKNIKNVKFIDNPPPKQWLSILNSVDIAVQLRENAFSFSSATVSELLGLRKKIVLTNGMVTSDWNNLVFKLNDGCSVNEIASKIEEALKTKVKNVNYNNLYKKYSFLSNAEQILKIIEK